MPLKLMTDNIKEETTELEKTVWLLQYGPYTEAVSIEQLISATKEDKVMRTLKKNIRRGYLPKSEKDLMPFAKIWDQLTISDSGLILKGEQIILPETLIESAIKKAHQGGHPGMTAMKRRLRAHFWCPKLNEKVQEAVRNCKQCAMFTPKNRKNLLQPHKLKQFNAWEKVSVDLFGPMPDRRHIVVAQDMVSKFPAAKILNKTDAAHVTGALREFYTAYGTPLIHRTDNGPPFNSKEFEIFSKEQGISHEKAFPYHPQANPVETLMRPLGKTMKSAHSGNANKEEALNHFLAAYRATPHSATGIAPGDIMFRHGYGNSFPRVQPPTDQTVREALDQDEQAREERDTELNLTRMKPEFEVGDTVYTKNNGHTKFQPAYGPDPRTIVSVEDGGVTCINEQGTVQRRHQDDIKKAPEPSKEPQPAESAEIEDSNPPRRTVRNRKQNPKYHDFHMY